MKKILGSLALTLTILGISICNTSDTVHAAAWGGEEASQYTVSKEENQRAIEYLEKVAPEALENLPFPKENLTLEKSQTEKDYELLSSVTKQARAAKKWYSVSRYSSTLIVSNYLVPVGYTDRENGIPIGTVELYAGQFCIPQSIRATWSVADAGGYGTGGYWWTLFRATENTVGRTKNIWLSAWNLDHLVYG
ncbi:hypothetical protein [Enterococcus sp. AZ192]|uniref:hypothetical protein n=1 Tax=unclassified Enterococcus TaxID=2608891 RepID=UPI003D2BA597